MFSARPKTSWRELESPISHLLLPVFLKALSRCRTGKISLFIRLQTKSGGFRVMDYVFKMSLHCRLAV